MKPYPIYLKVKDYLINLILLNENVLDYRIPSENQLALKFNASRSCVRQAISLLVEEGLLYSHKGKGTYINNRQQKKISLDLPLKIAFISPSFESELFNDIVSGMRSYIADKKIDIAYLLSIQDGRKHEELNVAYAKKLECNGIILNPVDSDNFNDNLLTLTANQTPVIFIDKKIFAQNISCVSSNHYEIGYQAGQYLSARHQHSVIITLNTMGHSVYERVGVDKTLR